MQPEQGPRRDPARPPAPLGAPGSGRARANSPERSGTTPQGWKLEPGFSCAAPRGPSPLPWLPAAPRAWAALCGRCVRRQPTCPPAQASASGPRAAAAPSASQGSGPLTAGAPGTRVLADQPRPRRGSLRSGPERELAARGRGGAPPHRPSREWGAAASPGAWASLPLCRPPCGSGAPLPLVTSPALRPRRRPPSLPAPSRVQGAAWEQRKGGGPSRAVGAAGRRGFSVRRGAGETRRQKAPGLSHCVWRSSERQGPSLLSGASASPGARDRNDTGESLAPLTGKEGSGGLPAAHAPLSARQLSTERGP